MKTRTSFVSNSSSSSFIICNLDEFRTAVSISTYKDARDFALLEYDYEWERDKYTEKQKNALFIAKFLDGYHDDTYRDLCGKIKKHGKLLFFICDNNYTGEYIQHIQNLGGTILDHWDDN